MQRYLSILSSPPPGYRQDRIRLGAASACYSAGYGRSSTSVDREGLNEARNEPAYREQWKSKQ